MRSELVAQAALPIGNRYLLMHVTSVLSRKFHRRGTARIPVSINNSLRGLADGRFIVTAGDLISEGFTGNDRLLESA